MNFVLKTDLNSATKTASNACVNKGAFIGLTSGLGVLILGLMIINVIMAVKLFKSYSKVARPPSRNVEFSTAPARVSVGTRREPSSSIETVSSSARRGRRRSDDQDFRLKMRFQDIFEAEISRD
jgi:hypothetical protein